MAPHEAIVIVDKNQMWVVSGKELVQLSDVSAGIVMSLYKSNNAMSGLQLARELSVTQSAITKAAAKLVDLSILRRESLPMAKNIKMYSLAVNIFDEKRFDSIRKKVPARILQAITEKLGGHEKLALAFLSQFFSFVDNLSEADKGKVIDQLMESLTGVAVNA